MQYALCCKTVVLLSLLEGVNTLKNAGLITNTHKQGQRGIIRFLSAEECKPVEIHRRMVKTVSGEMCLSKIAVIDSLRMFRTLP